MTKTATVKEVPSIRSWNGTHGTVWFHKLVLDNGDIGEIGAKKENAYRPGDSLTYTAEQTEFGLKFKRVQENGFNKGFGQKPSTSAMALAYGKDIIVAQIAAGKTGDLKTMDLADAALKVAEKFHTFIKEHE